MTRAGKRGEASYIFPWIDVQRNVKNCMIIIDRGDVKAIDGPADYMPCSTR
jgi:hypothetical protein